MAPGGLVGRSVAVPTTSVQGPPAPTPPTKMQHNKTAQHVAAAAALLAEQQHSFVTNPLAAMVNNGPPVQAPFDLSMSLATAFRASFLQPLTPVHKLSEMHDAPKKKLSPLHLDASRLEIGRWNKEANVLGPNDELKAKMIFSANRFVWEFSTDSAGNKAKVEVPFEAICGLDFETLVTGEATFTVELKHPPAMYLGHQVPQTNTRWSKQQADFTGGEAHRCRYHRVYFKTSIALLRLREKIADINQRLKELALEGLKINPEDIGFHHNTPPTTPQPHQQQQQTTPQQQQHQQQHAEDQAKAIVAAATAAMNANGGMALPPQSFRGGVSPSVSPTPLSAHNNMNVNSGKLRIPSNATVVAPVPLTPNRDAHPGHSHQPLSVPLPNTPVSQMMHHRWTPQAQSAQTHPSMESHAGGHASGGGVMTMGEYLACANPVTTPDVSPAVTPMHAGIGPASSSFEPVRCDSPTSAPNSPTIKAAPPLPGHLAVGHAHVAGDSMADDVPMNKQQQKALLQQRLKQNQQKTQQLLLQRHHNVAQAAARADELPSVDSINPPLSDFAESSFAAASGDRAVKSSNNNIAHTNARIATVSREDEDTEEDLMEDVDEHDMRADESKSTPSAQSVRRRELHRPPPLDMTGAASVRTTKKLKSVNSASSTGGTNIHSAAMEDVETTAAVCRCTTGCRAARCACMANWSACGPDCKCKGCRNPAGRAQELGVPLRLAKSDTCFLSALDTVTAELLNQVVEIPCLCSVPANRVLVRHLIGGIECVHCHAGFSFSFCEKRLCFEDVKPRNHCEACNKCTEYRSKHCNKCGRCFYAGSRGAKCPCVLFKAESGTEITKDVSDACMALLTLGATYPMVELEWSVSEVSKEPTSSSKNVNESGHKTKKPTKIPAVKKSPSSVAVKKSQSIPQM
eukprot:GFYU01000501.1.p1 GENE.GFYU01000501.1~~GFYU01000501.1.p1  ORF type:complete len:913 (+),score=199.11 GFYU01000501.1:132-2870(+)